MKLTKTHRCEYCSKLATHKLMADKGYVRYSCKDCWQRIKETAITDGVETATILVQGYFEVKMTEPTLEEKLRAVSSLDVCFSIGKEFDVSWIQPLETFVRFNNRVSKHDFKNLTDAINWLYETAKREGYLE